MNNDIEIKEGFCLKIYEKKIKSRNFRFNTNKQIDKNNKFKKVLYDNKTGIIFFGILNDFKYNSCNIEVIPQYENKLILLENLIDNLNPDKIYSYDIINNL